MKHAYVGLLVQPQCHISCFQFLLACIDTDDQSLTAAVVATHLAFVAMATATGNNQTAADR